MSGTVLLDNGADVNASGGKHGNALQVASLRGNDQVVRLLLDNGTDVNLSGGMYGSGLQAASEEAHSELVRILPSADSLDFQTYC